MNPMEVLSLPYDKYLVFLNNIGPIEAREDLRALKLSRDPWMKKEGQKSLGESLMKKANPVEKSSKKNLVSLDDAARMLLNG